jgi:hypothetical protein
MATAYAKTMGQIGVWLATSRTGGIHLLNGPADAKLGRMPVLAITGMRETSCWAPGSVCSLSASPRGLEPRDDVGGGALIAGQIGRRVGPLAVPVDEAHFLAAECGGRTGQ